jgi:hypothetical protein
VLRVGREILHRLRSRFSWRPGSRAGCATVSPSAVSRTVATGPDWSPQPCAARPHNITRMLSKGARSQLMLNNDSTPWYGRAGDGRRGLALHNKYRSAAHHFERQPHRLGRRTSRWQPMAAIAPEGVRGKICHGRVA